MTFYQKRYLTDPQLCARYGGRSKTWLWRKRKSDPNWPEHLVIDSRNYTEEHKCDEYDEAHRAVTPDIKAIELEETASA
jgi:hypothetical protein